MPSPELRLKYGQFCQNLKFSVVKFELLWSFNIFPELYVSLLSKIHSYFSPIKIISSIKCMIPRENPPLAVLQRIWMLYLCWDAEWCQVSPSPHKTCPKNPPKHQAAILCGSVLSVHVTFPRAANSRWSGEEGMSTDIFCNKNLHKARCHADTFGR